VSELNIWRNGDFVTYKHLLQSVDVHNNSIDGGGKTGAVADNGADLTTRNLTWENNTFTIGASCCGLSC